MVKSRVSQSLVHRPNPPKRWWQRARDAITGRFLRLKDALLRKDTTIIEKMNRK